MFICLHILLFREDLDLQVVLEKPDNLVHKVEKAAKVSQVPGDWQEA